MVKNTKKCKFCGKKGTYTTGNLEDSIKDIVCPNCSTTGRAYLLPFNEVQQKAYEYGKELGKNPSQMSEGDRRMMDEFLKDDSKKEIMLSNGVKITKQITN